MTIADRQDFRASLSQQHAAKQAALMPAVQLVAGAAVVMDKLQRTEEWSRYVTYLQGYVDRMAKQKEGALRKLGDPGLVDGQQVQKLRNDIFMADVTIDTLTFAIQLPAYILKGGEEANEFIKKFEKKNETPGNA